MILPVILLLSAAEIGALVPPDTLPFTDRYAYIRLRPAAAEDRLQISEEMTRQDPDDVLGSWLKGATLAGLQVPQFRRQPVDSAGIARLLQELELNPKRPGLWISAGATGKAGGGKSRENLLQAIDLYREQGREEDAFHVQYLLVRVRPADSETAEDLQSFRIAAEARGDPTSKAMYLYLAARDVYRRDFQESLRLREEALPILRTLPPGVLLIDCLNGIGNSRRRGSDFDGAQPFYEEALPLARERGFEEQELASLEGLALIAKNRREWPRALELFEQNLKLAESSGDVSSYVTTLNNARQIHRAQGNYLEGRRMAERALELSQEHNLEGLLPASLDAMAAEELLIGRTEHGRALLEEGVRIAEENGRTSDLVFPLIHLANVSEDLGDYDRAMEYTQRGLAIARSTGHKRGEAHLRAQNASLLYDLERYEESLAEALPIVHDIAGGDPGLAWSTARTAAESLVRLDRVDEAIALLDSCDARNADDSVHPIERLRNLSMKGEILSSSGRLAEGIPLLESARESFVALGDPLNVATSNSRLADAYLRAGRAEEALPLFEQCVTWSEELQSGLTVGEDRTSYLNLAYDEYVGYATACARMGRTDDAFLALERSRASEMRRLFGSAAPGLPERIRPELAQEIERVEAHLAVLQATVLEQRAKPTESRSPDYSDLVARTDSLRRQRDDLVRDVQREAPNYSRELGLAAPIGAPEVARALERGEVFLATMVGTERTLVFRGTTAGWSCRELAWGEERMREHVQELVGAVLAGGDAWRPLARSLADSLLGGEPWDGTRCIVAPDGPLHCLPFEILEVRAASSEERSLLIERAEVVITPSATIYLAHAGVTPARNALALVAFGDPALSGDSRAPPATVRAGSELELRPLPYARREVEQLGSRFPGSRVFVGDEATERRFFEEAARASVLHVASHAIVDDRQPSYSGLVLTAVGDPPASSSDDGFVQAFEILRHDLPLDLVTLSACDTGRGKLQRGEGLLGLSRAFRLAGAHTLLVSLWEVDDAATAELMTEFYAQWTRGTTIPAALRAAKLRFLESSSAKEPTDSRGVSRRTRSERRASPALWAPFVLQGTKATSTSQGPLVSGDR